MAKTLLFKNDAAINSDKNHLNNLVPYLQSVVNELTNLGISPTIGTVRELAFIVLDHRGLSAVVEYVTNLMVEAVENPQIGSLSISKEKLKSIIEIPDCSTLLSSLQQLVEKSYNQFRRATNIVYTSYFEINNGIVSKLETIDASMEAANSFYSENANQIEMFQKVTDFANACNTIEAYMKGKNRNIDLFKNLSELEIITKQVNGVTVSEWVPAYTYITNNFK